MNTRPHKRRLLISNAMFVMTFVAVSSRALYMMWNTSDVLPTLVLLAFYLALLLAAPWLIARRPVNLHTINALQTAIALFLLVFIGELDFFALLFIPPCGQSIQNFRRKTALAWIVGICLLMIAALLAHFPLEESIGYVIIYPAAVFLFTGFSYLAIQAEEAQLRSEKLLADLQQANRKLQAYTAQVQELAAANERNRLARELHDSVTQTIFGLTLSAQAARILMDRNPARAAVELDHLQGLAQNALSEMRALIQQLHPRSIAEEGLAAGLRRLVAEQHANHDLTVELQIFGERRLPVKIEEELFCIAQEALNNIVKHAQTDQAVIALHLADEKRVEMRIEDHGVGFDPARTNALPGHLGLTSMSERIQALGGTLTINSLPGKGTRVQVDLALNQALEVEHAG